MRPAVVLGVGKAAVEDEDGVAPIAAALALRALHHATAAGRLAADGQPDLIDWSLTCYSSWAERLDVADHATGLATAATDQVNLLLGILCLPDAAVREAVGDAYVAWFERLIERGIVPVATPLRPIFGTLVAGLTAEWAEPLQVHCRDRPAEPSVTEDFGAGDLAVAGLAATAFGSRPARIDDPNRLAHLLGALGIRAARNWDLADAALALLASALWLGRACPPALPSWLNTVARANGLAAPAGYVGQGGLAVLLGTTNLYLALHALDESRGGLYPGVRFNPDRRLGQAPTKVGFGRPSGRARTEVLDRLRGWVGANLDTVRMLLQTPEGIDRALRCGAEFAIVLCTLASCGSGWATANARQLQRMLDDERVLQHFRGAPERAPLLRPWFLLPAATGEPSPFAAEAGALVAAPHAVAIERPPMERLEYLTLCELADLPYPHDGEADILRRTLLFKAEGDPLSFSRNDLYDVTHTVFYATRFGKRDPDVLGAALRWLREFLPGTTLSCLVDGDYDLGAELLLATAYSGIDDPWAEWHLQLLAGAVKENGALPLPSWIDAATDRSECFVKDYHTVLMTLLCLTAFGRPAPA